MKTEQKTIYITDDGKLFDSQVLCEAYEKEQADKAAHTSYWRVTHNPDTTEGRGYYGLLLIECYFKGYVDLECLISDYCYRKFGRPLDFVMDVQPMESWIVRRSDRKQYLDQNAKIRVGDYDYPAKWIRLVLGENESGLIEEGTSGERD